MRLFQHSNGYFYCEIERGKRISLKTRSIIEAEKFFLRLKEAIKDKNLSFADKLARSIQEQVNRLGPNGDVYFIQSKYNNYIKIGFTKNIYQRFRIMQSNSPIKLTLLGIIKPGSLEIEGEIHRKFSKLRCHGEWFCASDDLLEFIEKACVDNAK